MRLVLLIVLTLLPAGALPLSGPALAQRVLQNVPPSPGTIEDPDAVIKAAADGPPRALIGIDVPVRPKQLAVAESIARR